jgi:hypothetical protein
MQTIDLMSQQIQINLPFVLSENPDSSTLKIWFGLSRTLCFIKTSLSVATILIDFAQ